MIYAGMYRNVTLARTSMNELGLPSVLLRVTAKPNSTDFLNWFNLANVSLYCRPRRAEIPLERVETIQG
jgi:hypothetical protein